MGNLDIDVSGLLNSMRGGNSDKIKNTRTEKPKNKQNKKSDNNFNNNSKNNPKMNENKFQGYVGAPYNFVPVSNKVYEYPAGTLTMHDDVSEELISGEIDYDITAETPIFIDDGTNEHQFHKNSEGEYAIPGSTIRGLIRNNVQILGFSSIFDDIDDYALMYRNVAKGAEKDRYSKILGSKPVQIPGGSKVGVLLNVKAGYIYNKSGKYFIYRTKIDSIRKEYKEMNYYVLSERKIVDDYLKYNPETEKFPFDFFVQKDTLLMQHKLKKFHRVPQNGRVHFIGETNPQYKPYFLPVSYKIKNQKDVVAVGEPGVYENAGYVISTGKMNEKKVIYVIPGIDKTKEPILIAEKDVTAFRIDIEKKKNSLKQFGGREFFDLPEEGQMKPVFYIQLDGRLYFGFTPRLRLFYDYTVKQGLNKNHKKGIVDYAKAMFGYSNQDTSYKSRLSFSDAVISEKKAKELNTRKVILAEPKPTSYMDYLKQFPNPGITYNHPEFEIRGIKQYWLHKECKECEIRKNDNVASTLNPLDKGTVFSGKVRFHSLRKDELGLLLWSMQLRDNSWMNIGKAKAFGYGNISVKITDVREFNKKKAYLSPMSLDLNPFDEITPDEYITYYQKFISNKLKIDFDKNPTIQAFFDMKDSDRIPDEKAIEYMDLKEYQKRNKPLPLVKEVIKENK